MLHFILLVVLRHWIPTYYTPCHLSAVSGGYILVSWSDLLGERVQDEFLGIRITTQERCQRGRYLTVLDTTSLTDTAAP